MSGIGEVSARNALFILMELSGAPSFANCKYAISKGCEAATRTVPEIAETGLAYGFPAPKEWGYPKSMLEAIAHAEVMVMETEVPAYLVPTLGIRMLARQILDGFGDRHVAELRRAARAFGKYAGMAPTELGEGRKSPAIYDIEARTIF